MNADEKMCPVCAETIKKDASVCRFCGAKATNWGSWKMPGHRPNSFQSCMGCLGVVFLIFLVLASLPSP